MVSAPATADAIDRARRLPELRVGLHVVLVNGRPTLPPGAIPDLLDERGEFLTDLVQAGFRFFLRASARRQLVAEIRAQFEAFSATGLALDHVDAQCHMHVHPTVFAAILAVGRDYGLRAIRIPREPFWPSWRSAGSGFRKRLGNSALTEPWLALMRLHARRAGLACNDYAFGVNDPGAMTEDRILRLIDRLPNGVVEMLFHPATGPFENADRGTEAFAWQGELAALTSPRVRGALRERGVEVISFGEVAGDDPR